jgi:hypothetical protein
MENSEPRADAVIGKLSELSSNEDAGVSVRFAAISKRSI